jgi:putative hydrolase of the HAD superfamily
VSRLGASGYGVHLATNQEQYRARHMQNALGYAALFDTCFYSCELGVAKPDPAFFIAVVDTLGVAPASILFVDDSERNVLAARAAGLAAVHWHLDAGHAALVADLTSRGIRTS